MARLGVPRWSVAQAWRRIEKRAEAMGYSVCRVDHGETVTLTLLWLGPTHPHVRLVDVVPNEWPEDPARTLDVITSGLAIPHRVCPTTVDEFLDFLSEFERSIA